MTTQEVVDNLDSISKALEWSQVALTSKELDDAMVLFSSLSPESLDVIAKALGDDGAKLVKLARMIMAVIPGMRNWAYAGQPKKFATMLRHMATKPLIVNLLAKWL